MCESRLTCLHVHFFLAVDHDCSNLLASHHSDPGSILGFKACEMVMWSLGYRGVCCPGTHRNVYISAKDYDLNKL